ncbi:GntR family transcriptional regulator [Pseudochelatococcus sp. B33]
MNEELVDKSDHASSSERLVEEIRTRIVSGELRPGAKITERELAQRYGVNRAPLREALLRLEERRLIERVPFSGTRVFQPSNRMLSELYDIREVLEGLAARRAAETASDAQIEELTRMAREGSERIANSSPGDLPHIRDIHMRIAEISGNQELERILNGEIWLYLRANHRRWVDALEKRALGALQHERIAEAIRSRDGDVAEMLMRKHIRTSRAAWVEALKSLNGAS